MHTHIRTRAHNTPTPRQIGSIFEYVNKNPIFGVLPPSNPLYAPILGLFALTGLPTAGACA